MTGRRKQLARLLIVVVGLGMVVAAWTLVAWFRGAPARRRMLITMRTGHIGYMISCYVYDHGAPPFGASGTFDEYLAKASGHSLSRKLDEAGRHCVFVNLRPEEWAAVRAYLEARTPRKKPTLLAGWLGDRVEGRGGRWRWVITFEEGRQPSDTDEFRAEVLAMAEAVRAALGKSLADCLIYNEGDFDAATFGLDESPPAEHEPVRETGDPGTPYSSRDSNGPKQAIAYGVRRIGGCR